MSTQVDRHTSNRNVRMIEDSPVARSLFGDVRWAWIWLLLRLYLGYEWLSAGWGKLHNAAWVGSKAGTALTGFVNGALAKTAGDHPDVQAWYGWFLQHVVLTNARTFSYLVSFGETLVGIALILGLFTGIAAFLGGFMNWNFMMAGSASTNPVLFTLSILLILAWKTAGWWGLDRFVLTALGTPWQPGKAFQGKTPENT